MWNRSFRLGTIVALATVLGACDQSITTPFDSEPEIAAASVELGTTIDLAAVDARSDDTSLFDQLAAEIPGFGGFWFDRHCNLNVVLTNLEQSELAKQVLTPYLRRYVETHRCPDTATIVVQRGEFTWEQLKTWLRELDPATGFRGVARIGIAVQINRIVVAVDGRPAAHEVLRLAQDVGVPAGAIKFVLASSSDRARDGRTTDRR